jgi:photosystem II stability/assembly factor-like uncharacterized protein
MAWLHAVCFLNEEHGWAVGGGGALLETVDGGATWKRLARPTEDTIRDVYFADEQSGWIVCERSVYLLKTKDEPRTYLMNTTDGGASWKRVNIKGSDAEARMMRAVFTEGGRGWIFGEGGALYTTRDHGATWARQNVPTRRLLLGGAFLSDDQGWLVGAGATLLQTSDGGETWREGRIASVEANGNVESRVSDASKNASLRFNAASFVDARHGWAVGAGGSVYATRDGGWTWRAEVSNTEVDLYDIKFLDALEGWAVGAEGTIIHTADSGAHWTIVPSGTTHPLERLAFVNRGRGYAVGFGGTIIAYNANATTPAPELKR